MRLVSKKLLVLSLLVLAMALIPGCEDQEAARSVLHIVRIANTDVELEQYSYVLLSDVVVGGSVDEPGTVFEDEVYFTIRNDSRSSINPLDPNSLFGRVTLTEYRVDYKIDDEYLPPLESSMNIVVGSGEERIAKLVMVTAISKLDPPLSTLAWEPEELLCQAKITMTGYEETSNDKIEVVGYMDIHFANWSDAD
jgi:hypothetical protein